MSDTENELLSDLENALILYAWGFSDKYHYVEKYKIFLTESSQSIISYLNGERKKRRKVLLTAIDLCGEPETAMGLFIISSCYAELGEKYSKQAIYYLEKYISIGASWSGTPHQQIEIQGGYVYDQLKGEQAHAYYLLGSSYCCEHEFSKAEDAYKKAVQLDPYCSYYVIGVADTYVKRNDFQGALSYLIEKTECEYYKHNIHFYKEKINLAIDKIIKRIKEA